MKKKLPQYRWMSLWRHFFDRERTVDQLTSSMIEWQEKWNWDFMKINPPACYHVLDWGAEYEFFNDATREPELRKPVVSSDADIRNIPVLDPAKGVLGEQLQVIWNLRQHFGNELPMVETIFSPIEIAHRLMSSREAFDSLRKSSPQKAHDLLETIQETFLDFALRCLEAGADGIFFATKWSTSDLMSWNEYEEFGKRYEQPILSALHERNALLILHICGERTYLNRMLDYPADIFSYDFFAEGIPAPEEVVTHTGKFVLGGIDPQKLVSDPDRIVEDCKRLSAIPQWLVGPSCVITHEATNEAIDKANKVVRTSRPRS
jgi:uroporphyrinogen decarboxylase